jgi:ABC-type polysaccharide/polyol phosphate transport system ATPase subunit
MSNDDVVIRVRDLGKKFLVPQRHEQDYSKPPTWQERLKEFFPGLMGADETDEFWALRNVSFEVRQGEVLGIVGENGSGKSTLLKILSGVTPPTEGCAELRGRVGSLLEVGTGFHPDLTGRENIFFNGALLGATNAEIRSRIGAIIEFSGIGEFIDVPVKRYSSGMYVRLAYSVASLLRSEILILDEVLSVGDENFRSKTQDHIRETTKAGKTILFVSHNPRQVATICDRAIILYKGQMVFVGDAKEVLAEYLSSAYKRSAISTSDGERPKSTPQSEPSKRTSADVGAIRAAGKPSDQSSAAQQKSDGAQSGKLREMAAPVRPRSLVDLSKAPRFKDPSLPPPSMVLKWMSVHGLDGTQKAEFSTGEGIRVRIGYEGLAQPDRTYFCLLIHNSAQDRMTTIYSVDSGNNVGVKESGTVECIIPALMLGVGLYSVMVDTGDCDLQSLKFLSRDCVSYATFIRVKDKGFLKGGVLTEFQGVVHRSEWSMIEGDKPVVVDR